MTKIPGSGTDYKRSIVLGALAGIGLALVFSAGFFFRDFIGLLPAQAQNHSVTGGDQEYPLLDEVQALLDAHYYHPQPDSSVRQYAAIRGVLSTLDDHNTFFIEPPTAQSESDALAGTYGGIGVLLQRAESGDIVLFAFADGPAAAAGVQDGDILKQINGVDVDSSQNPDAVDQMLRGEVGNGNGVSITIEHPDTGKDETVFIEFAVINIPSVVWRVLPDDPRIGYVHVLRFTNRTPSELETALNELNTANIEALALDLRNNGGGLLQESIAVASQFLDGGVVTYEESKTDQTTYTADPGGMATKLPLVVLVNGGTASAAELVSGAIQDRGRGILIGQKTYGKGTVQQIYALEDGSSVHITSAEWFTPNHNQINGVGLEPDITMIPDVSGRDVELGEAVRHLQQELETESTPTP